MLLSSVNKLFKLIIFVDLYQQRLVPHGRLHLQNKILANKRQVVFLLKKLIDQMYVTRLIV